MSPGDIPPSPDYIQEVPQYRFKDFDELMEMKYGVGNESRGGNMNIGRASLYAFLFGVLLMLAASPAITGFVKDVTGTGSTYFAVRSYLNFATGGLTNLVGLQAWTAAVVLYGLSRRSS